jgi:hypothetical protein
VSQREALQALDRSIFQALLEVGLADQAIFQPLAGGAAIPCTVVVTRGAQVFDDTQQVAGMRTTVDFLKSEIPDAQRGDILTVGSDEYTLDARIDVEDESRVRWVVLP